MANKTIGGITGVSTVAADADLREIEQGGVSKKEANSTLKTYMINPTVNKQTSTAYTVAQTDNGKLVTQSNAASSTYTLPVATTFINGWWTSIQNVGAGTLTITPTTSTIDGVSSLVLLTGQGCRIWSDGANYFTGRGSAGLAKVAMTGDKTDVGLSNVDNTSDMNKPVSTAQAAADASTLTSAKAYADSLVVGLLDFRGAYDASGNTYPTSADGGSGTSGAVLKGDVWVVSVQGTLNSKTVFVGDTLTALVDTPAQTNANWNIIKNETGYTPENIGNKATDLSTNDNTHYPTTAAVQTALNTKEPAIAAGTTAQYWRGDKSWQTLATVGGTGAYSDLTGKPTLTVDALTNVTITSKATNDLLQWNGTAWVNKAFPAAGIVGNSLMRPTQSISSASGVVTINLSNPYEVYLLTLTENVTSWSFTNLPASGFTAELRIKLIQDASTAYTCVSPASTGMTAGGAWVNSSTLSSIESLGIAIDSSGNKTLFPSGVYA